MKRTLLVFTALFGAAIASQADTLAQWDFNFPTTATVFPSGDTNGATGTFAPLIGSGSLTNIGGAGATFGAQASKTTDPWTTDNSALRLGSYNVYVTNADNSVTTTVVGNFPSSSSANKTAGFQLLTSTVGYENIQVAFDQENSGSASKYWRAQYTTNGTTWQDLTVFEAAGSTAWLLTRVVDLSTVPGVKNNPNFGFRYVSEFSSTASGTGEASYVGNSGNYSTVGTLWVDMVTVTGTPLDTSNTSPTISSIAARTNRINQAVGPISFTIGDLETPTSQLTLSATSSNPELFQDYNMTFGGSGANRTVSLTPEADQTGASIITIVVTDAGGKATSTQFMITTLPANTAPTIAAISEVDAIANTTTNVPLSISDLETDNDDLTYAIESSNEALVPASVAQVVGTGANKTLQISAGTNALGSTKFTLTVSDGSLTDSTSFYVKVTQPLPVVHWNFNDADSDATTGTLTPDSGSGTLKVIGDTVTYTFGNVATTDLAPYESSPRLTKFPAQGEGNKTSGIEFHFSTVGFKNIAMCWDQQNSATANRYWRVQYALDGVNFVDHTIITNWSPGATIQTGANFLGIAGAANNANFGVRIVSELESSIDVTSTNGYVGTQASGGYGTGGTCWFDMLTVTAEAAAPMANLTATKSGNNVVISWPSAVSGTLYGTASLTSADWQPVIESATEQNGVKSVTIPATTGNRFFRLQN